MANKRRTSGTVNPASSSVPALFFLLLPPEVVLQEIEENLGSMEFRHLFCLGNHSKQPGDQHNLPSHIPFCHPLQLPFSHHVHHLISL